MRPAVDRRGSLRGGPSSGRSTNGRAPPRITASSRMPPLRRAARASATSSPSSARQRSTWCTARSSSGPRPQLRYGPPQTPWITSARRRQLAVAAELEARRSQPPRGRRDDPVGVLERRRQRLLDEDVATGRQRFDGDLGVRIRWRADRDEVDALDQLGKRAGDRAPVERDGLPDRGRTPRRARRRARPAAPGRGGATPRRSRRCPRSGGS